MIVKGITQIAVKRNIKLDLNEICSYNFFLHGRISTTNIYFLKEKMNNINYTVTACNRANIKNINF